MPSVRPSPQCCAAIRCRRGNGPAWQYRFGHVACDFFAPLFHRHESVTFSRTSVRHAAFVRAGSSIMIGLVRAATLCATLALGLVTAQAADKAFKRDDLADSAIKLEAQIKSEAGPVAKSGATLANRRRRRLQAQRFPHRPANPRADRRHRARGQRQLAAAGPHHFPDPARPTAASRPSCWSAPRPRPTSPISAPAMPARRPTRWPCSAARCPNASCGGRRWMRCGCRSTCAKSPTCAANTRKCATSTASGCWTTPSIPIRRRRAPASSSPRTSPSAPTSRRSWRWRAATSRRCRRKASSSASMA